MEMQVPHTVSAAANHLDNRPSFLCIFCYKLKTVVVYTGLNTVIQLLRCITSVMKQGLEKRIPLRHHFITKRCNYNSM
jgi:hypothetical protein